jgi:hypothetical protein
LGTKSSGGAQMNARPPPTSSVEAQQVAADLGGVDEHAAEHDRSELVEAEMERGDDAEVSAAPTESPEQIRVLVFRCRHDAAVGRDDFGL